MYKMIKKSETSEHSKAMQYESLLGIVRIIMKEKELITLGFEKDKLLDGQETGKWKMPWGGTIEISENEDIHSILLRGYNIGRSTGIFKGEQIGVAKLQLQIRELLGI